MKKLICSMLAVCLFVFPGCVGAVKKDSTQFANYKKDVFVFSNLAVGVVLRQHSEKLTEDNVKEIKGYINAAVDFLNSEEDADFDDMKMFISSKIPDQYVIVANSILNYVEMYVLSLMDNLSDDQVKAKELILSGLQGALKAVEEFKK